MSATPSAIRPNIADLVALRIQARHLGSRAAGRIRAQLMGQHRSRLRGRGMDFREVREYQPGDDIRCIDWRVTARTGRAHTKLFNEERERPVILLIDQRPTMHFATRGVFKSVLAARAGTLLGWRASAHGDRVGALVFHQSHHRELRPAGGDRGVLRLINALTQPPADTPVPPQDLASQAGRLARIVRPGSLVFAFSDFDGWNDHVAGLLAPLARHSALVLGLVHDPLEAHPPTGHYPLSDGERLAWLDPQRAEHIRQQFFQHRQTLAGFCRQYGAHLLELATDHDPIHALRMQLAALAQDS